MSIEEKKTAFKRTTTSEFLEEDRHSSSSHIDGKPFDSDTVAVAGAKRKDYLICIDPESFRQYRLDLSQPDMLIDETKYPEEIAQKVAKHHGIIKRMLQMPNFHWVYERSAEVNRYRRRVFPSQYVLFLFP